MTTVLDSILANKRREVSAKYDNGYYAALEKGYAANADSRNLLSFSKRLTQDSCGIIAEFKRRSPSKGEIHKLAIAGEVVADYAQNGAACCSVLTDTAFFGGSVDDFAEARAAVDLPLLRKDFIIDPMQILEAAFYGANAVLLIASALKIDEINSLNYYAHSLGVETLLELHGMDELDKIDLSVDMIGVNNRNLATFATDTSMSDEMINHLPANIVKVAESGISSIDDVKRLREKGYQGFLIGESFMKYENPGEALKNFINENK